MFRLTLALILLSGSLALADEPSAARGLQLLLEKAYVPAHFDEECLDEVWRVWPAPLRSQAKTATAEQRRQMAFERYGLTRRPDATKVGKSMQYVVTHDGEWVPNCLSCHGGEVDGQPYPGRPNHKYAMQTLTEEMLLVKQKLRKPLKPIDLGSLVMPLGKTVGTTNAIMFGVALGSMRDKDLNLVTRFRPPPMTHHDMDAPPWWHFKKRPMLYIDGFATKSHRSLMQFALDRSNGPEKFREWENDFRHIYAYLESIEPPPWPHTIDERLAIRGRGLFEQTCAECHGTYGDDESYPNRIVPIEIVETDRVRLDALTVAARDSYRRNWFSHYGAETVISDPGGYVAPPLDGVWASAPYFHNGSVPTVWHVLHPESRPRVWHRTSDDNDTSRIGLTIESFERVPAGLSTAASRHYFDTRQFGKSADGHDFANVLSEEERAAVIEYLKTL